MVIFVLMAVLAVRHRTCPDVGLGSPHAAGCLSCVWTLKVHALDAREARENMLPRPTESITHTYKHYWRAATAASPTRTTTPPTAPAPRAAAAGESGAAEPAAPTTSDAAPRYFVQAEHARHQTELAPYLAQVAESGRT